LYLALMVLRDVRVGQFELFIGPKAAFRGVTTALGTADR
jgi:hypothetical protein